MKQLLLSIFITFSFSTVFGQMGGLDHNLGGPGMQKPSKPREKFDFVKTSTDNLTKQLTLDAFQSAAISNLLEDYKNSVMAIQALEIPEEAKAEKLQSERDKMEAKILMLLNKDQTAKYQELKDKLNKKAKNIPKPDKTEH